jgi:urease accessory protein
MIANNSIIDNPHIWHGKLNLIYAKLQKQTQLIHAHHQAPLKIQRAFYPEGEEICHSVALHTAGGVVGGDKLSYDVHLQENSQVLITTAAANKIYRSNGYQAQQNIQITLDSNSYLEWLPQETIIFNHANYHQNLRVELAENATFMGWEITRFGRSARGEKFIAGEFRSTTEIWRSGKPLWIDRQWVPGCEEVFHSHHGLAGNAIAGTLVWLKNPVSKEIVTQARDLWQGTGEIGVTRLEHGFLCRYRGSVSAEVRNWFTDVWQLLRMSHLNRVASIPRVWQI